MKRSVGEKIEEGLEPKELVTLQFSEAELKQLKWEHEREFEYKGQMYDVVERKMKGDTTLFVCWWDHEETRLKEEMRKLLARQDHEVPLKNNQTERIDTFQKNLYVIQAVFFGKNKLNDHCGKVFPVNGKKYSSPFQIPPTPPPDWS